ncbi:hypothetical protein GALL_509990 [mine drainage metagenome]|uniref:Uncharacterized protein n=1 Tax=mine drainage metagenome TaxID=410659 RepID=A0A1J5P850_9ZZZZ
MAFLHLQEFHVKSGVVRHQHRVVGKSVKRRQDLGDGWLTAHHVLGNAMNLDGGRRYQSARIDHLLEAFMTQQPAIDAARGPDLDDLVAGRRVQAGGFGVKHGIGQLAEQALVERAALIGGLKQIKVVELGAAAVVQDGRGIVLLLRTGQRQRESEKSLVPDPFAGKNQLPAVALNHVTHRQRDTLTVQLHVVHLPNHHGLGAHDLVRPDQVKPGHTVLCKQAQTQKPDIELVDQAGGQIHQCLDQAVAVNP